MKAEQYKKLLNASVKTSELLLSNQPLNEVINSVLEIVGLAANVDRVYIFENTYENNKLACLNYKWEWCNTGIEPQIDLDLLQGVPWDVFDYLKNPLSNGEYYCTNVKDISDKQFKETLEIQDIKCIIFTPIIFDNHFWGFAGFDDCKQERDWEDIEINTLYAICSNIALYLKRTQISKELSNKYVELELQKDFYENILNNIPSEVIVWDNKQRYVFVNKHAVANEDVRRWLIGKTDREYCTYRNKSLSLAEGREQLFNEIKNTGKAASREEKFNLPDGKYRKHIRFVQPVFNKKNKLEHAIGFSLDITKISEQEEIINKQNEAIKNSPDGIALLDANGHYYFMNRAHEAIFGYEEGELIGKHWSILYDTDGINYINKEVMPLLVKNGTWNGESKGITKNNKYIFQEITLKFLPDGSLLCITRDVSELKNNYHIIEEANHKLELAINNANLGMWTWNPKSDEVESNNIFKQMFYFLHDENGKFIKNGFKSWILAIDDKYRSNVENAINKVVKRVKNENDIDFSFEYRLADNFGGKWFLTFGRVVSYDEFDMPKSVIGFTIDTTTHKISEEKIKQSEKKYKDLVENLREVVFETDNQMRFTYLNPSWETLTGYSIKHTLSKPMLFFFHPEVKNDQITLINNFGLDNNRQHLHTELRLIKNDGSDLWVDIELNKTDEKLNTNNGHYWGSMENITARLLAEIELKNALEKEKQLGELKSRFVNMASHEFRTPLAGIRSSAELIMLFARKNNEVYNKLIEMGIDKKIQYIISDVDKVTSIMTDVLTMGKIEASKIKYSPALGNIASFIQQVIHEEATRYVEGSKINLINNVESCNILFDHTLLRHAFSNILNNAIKYSPHHTEINVYTNTTKDFFEVCVEDFGIGIPENELPFSFDSFFRSTNAENIPGTGLGLHISKYFIQLHHGEINIKSMLNKGTTVCFKIPLLVQKTEMPDAVLMQ